MQPCLWKITIWLFVGPGSKSCFGQSIKSSSSSSEEVISSPSRVSSSCSSCVSFFSFSCGRSITLRQETFQQCCSMTSRFTVGRIKNSEQVYTWLKKLTALLQEFPDLVGKIGRCCACRCLWHSHSPQAALGQPHQTIASAWRNLVCLSDSMEQGLTKLVIQSYMYGHWLLCSIHSKGLRHCGSRYSSFSFKKTERDNSS